MRTRFFFFPISSNSGHLSEVSWTRVCSFTCHMIENETSWLSWSKIYFVNEAWCLQLYLRCFDGVLVPHELFCIVLDFKRVLRKATSARVLLPLKGCLELRCQRGFFSPSQPVVFLSLLTFGNLVVHSGGSSLKSCETFSEKQAWLKRLLGWNSCSSLSQI